MDLIKLGSIRLSNEAQIPGFYCDSSGDVSFGDTVSGKELQWLKLKSGLLIADRCVCTRISWEQLDKKGFVFGAPIAIDGKIYWCRCLRVSSNEDKPNEWDTALDEIGEDNDLWHWDDIHFRGQETSEFEASARECRGYDSARGWIDCSASVRVDSLGFRPALEYLGSVSCSPDALLGKKARVYCPEGVTFEACLVDFSDYDIVLKTNSPIPVDCPWATKNGGNIIVSRGDIIWLKEG